MTLKNRALPFLLFYFFIFSLAMETKSSLFSDLPEILLPQFI